MRKNSELCLYSVVGWQFVNVVVLVFDCGLTIYLCGCVCIWLWDDNLFVFGCELTICLCGCVCICLYLVVG